MTMDDTHKQIEIYQEKLATINRVVVAIMVCVLLAGCSGKGVLDTLPQEKCVGFGITPGTDAMKNCVMREKRELQKQILNIITN